MKKLVGKLALRTETIRQLESTDLRALHGGAMDSIPVRKCQTTEAVWCGETYVFACVRGQTTVDTEALCAG